jgi:hypothetical protein
VGGIVANYNPTLGVIRWFVPVDGSPFNNFVIVLDLNTYAFTFDECDGISAVATVVGSAPGVVVEAVISAPTAWMRRRLARSRMVRA